VIGVLDKVKHRSFEPEELARFLRPETIDLMLEQLYLTHDLMTSELRIEKNRLSARHRFKVFNGTTL